jgi:T5orf172 domain
LSGSWDRVGGHPGFYRNGRLVYFRFRDRSGRKRWASAPTVEQALWKKNDLETLPRKPLPVRPRSRREVEDGSLYLACSSLWQPDVCKIGYSDDVERRMQQLRAEALVVVPGDRRLEAELKGRFEAWRVDGEYHRLVAPIVDLFVRLLTETLAPEVRPRVAGGESAG